MSFTQKLKIVEICKKVYQKGFVSAYDGNISARISDNRFLITRSGLCKGEARVDDILIIDEKGNKVSGNGKVTTEYKIHLEAYKVRKDVHAVVHCHPVFATAFASAGEDFSNHVFPEVTLTLGKVPLCRYAPPSTYELTESLFPHLEYSWALLLQNHGAVSFGKNLDDAYFKMEKLEHTAKTIFVSRMLGGEKSLSLTDVNKLLQIAPGVYGITQDERNIF
jgi:L-fuculose-phosphate aldolase